jgi:hypothetical protein
VLDELVEVGGVHVEPHDVGEGHVGSGQDVWVPKTPFRLQISLFGAEWSVWQLTGLRL